MIELENGLKRKKNHFSYDGLERNKIIYVLYNGLECTLLYVI